MGGGGELAQGFALEQAIDLLLEDLHMDLSLQPQPPPAFMLIKLLLLDQLAHSLLFYLRMWGSPMETITATVGYTYAPGSTMTGTGQDATDGSGSSTGGSEAYYITGDANLAAAPT